MAPVGDWITVDEAAAILGVSVATVRRRCAAGELEAHKSGRSWIIDRKSVPRRAVRTPPRRSGPPSSFVDFREAFLHITKQDLRQDVWVPDVLLHEDDLFDPDALIRAATERIDGDTPHDLASEIPVPKSPFFHRNAVNLSLVDRLAFHAVATSFADAIEETLSDSVYSARLSEKKSRLLRKGRNAWLAWRHAVVQELDNGSRYMVETDVTAYFDFVKHEILLQELQNLNNEKRHLIEPLRRMLKEWATTPNTGIPQGPDASRLLGNFYLDVVDHRMDDFQGVKYFRYMDDIRIVGPSRSAAIKALHTLDQECRRRGLALSAQKTKLLVGKPAIDSMKDPQLGKAHYAFVYASKDSTDVRKMLVTLFDKALEPEGGVNTRHAKFSLWRLYQLRERSVLDRVLDSLEHLAPLGAIVPQYLHPWLRRTRQPNVQQKIADYLHSPERNTSSYLSCWLMAGMLDIPDAIPSDWVTYARTIATNPADATNHRAVALNVLALGKQNRDLTALRDAVRREHDPEIVRAALVALQRVDSLSKETVRHAKRIPGLEPTITYLSGRNDLPSLVFRDRSHRNRLT